MSLNKIILATGTLLLASSGAEARGRFGGRSSSNGVAGRSASRSGQQGVQSSGPFGRRRGGGGRGGGSSSYPSAGQGEEGGQRGGRGGRGGKGKMVAHVIDKLEACEEELQMCSLDFNFDVDELVSSLQEIQEQRQQIMEEARESGERPPRDSLPKPTEEMIEQLKAVRECLHDVVKPDLLAAAEAGEIVPEENTCLAALTSRHGSRPPRPPTEEPAPLDNEADGQK